MNLGQIHTVYFLGIGGIGMSALARYFNFHGVEVSGYDKTSTPLTRELQSEGISIHYDPDPDAIPLNTDLVIITPAVPKTNVEWSTIEERNYPVMKRAQVLGLISDSGKCLAVAGTHGKTTTSAILSHIMKTHFGEVNAFVGGVMSEGNTNFLYAKNQPYFVVEADEFDRSFLNLNPHIAAINSMDADHLDIYGGHEALVDSFKAFARRVDQNGALVVKSDLIHHFEGLETNLYSFGFEANSDYMPSNVTVTGGRFQFDLKHPQGNISGLTIGLPGRHNIENATAASAIALNVGVSEDSIKKALASFQGVKRRFETFGDFNKVVYIDDYAHHPEEIKRVLEATRELYPTKKLTVIFQPHLFSRTKDFETEFAHILGQFDELILLPIYPAREEPIPGVTSEVLLKKVNNNNKQVIDKEDVVDSLSLNNLEVVLTLGAGDIDTIVEPIKSLVG